MGKTERLRPQDWLHDAATAQVVQALNPSQDGTLVRFVGGCVRNALLGQPVEDIDLATVHEPKAVIALLEAAGLQAVPTGLAHGTITAVAQGKPFEITTLRADIETDGRRAKVAFTRDWREDAERRDFTMNAIYADPDGMLFDPVGGIADAKAGRVQFIGDADARIMEDYLRILRFFRFNARYATGAPDETGFTACVRAAHGLKQLSGERVQAEFLKLLKADRAAEVVGMMIDHDLLRDILPEARGAEALAHLIEIETCQLFTCDAELRLAALIENSEAAVSALTQRWKLSNALRNRLLAIAQHTTELVCYLSMRETRRALYQMGQQLFLDRLMLTWAADPKTSNTVRWRALHAVAETWERPVFPLTGKDALAAGVPPGPEMGRVLAEVEDWWVDAEFTEDKFSLIERLKAVVQATII